MSTAISDTLKAIVAYMLANDAVAAEVGTRVFGMELPPDEAEHMPRKAIVIAPGSGLAPSYAEVLPLEAMTVSVICYGATPFEAMELRRAARAALKDLERHVRENVLLHWAKPAGGFAEEREQPTTWPRVTEGFTVLAAETAVA